MPKTIRGVEFPDAATPAMIEEFFAADSAATTRPARPVRSRLEGNVRGLASMIPTVSAGVGGVLGGLAGAPAAGVGAVPGAIMGATAGGVVGKTGEDLLLRALGMTPEAGAAARFLGAEPGGQVASGINALQEGGVNAAIGLVPEGPAMMRGLTRGTAGLAERVASAPILRHLPGANITRRVAGDVRGMATPKGPPNIPFTPEEAASRPPTAQAADPVPVSGAAVEPAAAPAPAPLPPLERIKAMRIRKNASAESREAQGVELELAMDEAKLSAQARKALRQRLGHETPKPASVPRGTSSAPRPATKATEATEAPELKAVKGGRPDDPLPQNDPSALKPEPLGPRHGVQKWSKSKKQHLTIENMNVPHLRASINEYGRDLAKLGKNARERAPVKAAVLDAMRAEIKHRGETSGVHGF